MSLLLDALKKAADDKQKTSQGEAKKKQLPDQAAAVSTVDSADNSPEPNEDLKLQDIDDELVLDDGANESIELTLEEDSLQQAALTDDGQVAASLDLANKEANPAEQLKKRKAASRKFTVSDDALSLLIYKTNRDVKYNKRLVVFSLFMFSFAVLISGGVYYYLDMDAEIAALERKHQLSMMAMQSKTSKEKVPEKSAIIRNLVGESNFEDKVNYAKNKISGNANQARSYSATNTSVNKNTKKDSYATPGLSIEKTNKVDPVGEKLDSAWLLYDSGKYSEAINLYREVLTLEKNNRDAMLGIGAIAVLQGDQVQARDIYMALLEQDPRDPVATAALTSLHSDDASLQADEEYLLAVLGKNPEAPHLSFALANNYAQQKKWQSAQKYYFAAWQSDIDNADYIFNLAVSMEQLGKPQQAMSFYKDSLLKSTNKQVSFSRDVVKKRIIELSGL